MSRKTSVQVQTPDGEVIGAWETDAEGTHKPYADIGSEEPFEVIIPEEAFGGAPRPVTDEQAGFHQEIPEIRVENPDPFADEGTRFENPPVTVKITATDTSQETREKMVKVMQNAERPLEIANLGQDEALPVFRNESGQDTVLEVVTEQQTALETYTRVSDVSPGPGFYKPEEIEGVDLVILGAVQRKGEFGPYLSIDFRFKDPNDNPDPNRGVLPYVVNMGGTVAVPKIIHALIAISERRAQGPLVAQFQKKSMSGNQVFWDVF